MFNKSLKWNFFRVLGTCAILLGNISICAQKPELHFSNININAHINDAKIWSFGEDKAGFIYFGGENGLYRYDGYQIENYRNQEQLNTSISNDRVLALAHDKYNQFWIGTGRGLNVFDPITKVFYNFLNPGKFLCLRYSSGHIDALSIDKNNEVWFVDKDKGLGHIKDVKSPIEYFTLKDSHDQIEYTSVAVSPHGDIFVGTSVGTYLFDISQKILVAFCIGNDERHNVNKLCASKDYLWISSYDGLWKCDYKIGGLRSYYGYSPLGEGLSGKIPGNILPYKNGILIAIDGGGINYLDLGQNKFYSYSSNDESLLNCDNITSLYIDRTGSIWAGTYMNGINVSNISTNFLPIVKETAFGTAYNCIINGFEKDNKGTLWVVTDRGGIFKKVAKSEKFNRISLSNGDIDLDKIAATDIEIIDDEVWIATWNDGLVVIGKDNKIRNYQYGYGEGNSFLINNRLRCIHMDHKRKQLWIGYFGTGISMYDFKNKEAFSYRCNVVGGISMLSDWVRGIYQDKNDDVWVFTANGINKYDRQNNNLKNISFKKNGSKDPNNSYINDIVQYDDTTMLIATNTGGIISMDLRSHHKYVFLDKYFNHGEQSVKSIITDEDGKVWFCTMHSIFKIEDIKNQIYIDYRSNEMSATLGFNTAVKYKDDLGRLYFGTNNGYLMVNPKMYIHNSNPPPVYITDVSIPEGEGLSKEYISSLEYNMGNKELDLEYFENDLSISFAALNYICPSNNKFKFRLEGAEEDWHIVSMPKPASYFNLTPGKYRFVVYACNNDGVWNNEGAVLNISIAAPWWRSWVFLISMTLFTALGIVALVRFRVNQIKAQKNYLEAEVNTRTEELQTANSTLETLLYRASHDIKGPVKSLLGLIAVGREEFGAIEKFNIYLEHINTTAKKLDTIVNELTLISNNSFVDQKEEIDFTLIVEEVKLAMSTLPNINEFDITFSVDQHKKFVSNKKVIYTIFQNLILNSFQYRDKGKKLSYLNIIVSQKGNEIHFVFNDNGIGIEQGEQAKVFDMFYRGSILSEGSGLGLFVVRTMVNKLGGSVKLVSSLGVGAEFKIVLPIS